MISIRELQPGDDLAEVLRLCREFFLEYENHHKEFFDTDNLCDDDISGRFLKSLESDDSATLIALDENKIIGYASLAIGNQPRFYKVKRVGHISALMVAKEYRRRGIATRILEESGSFFRRHGIKYYTFYTSVANHDAIGLYEKIGLEPLHISYLGET
nr:GNAT family N-acetyltransferase [candidate division Zixibacteria bacterium]